MVSDAALQHFRERFADQLLLVQPQAQRVGRGKLPREFSRQRLGRLPPRRENQNWAKIFSEGFRHQTRPVAPDLIGNVITQTVSTYLFERDRAKIELDQHRLPPEPS